jgi:hypothetical protein
MPNYGLPGWSSLGSAMRPLGGIVRSGQSDIEATSGAERVSTFRRPHMFAFQSRLTHRTPFAIGTGRNPPFTRATRDSTRPDDESSNHLDETITGRTRPA